ncbi:hypothetical protein INR49_009693 [Caranx melampygus]|nr:hypothetical protein INR49_009693 [Caranx melampygus]
MMLGAGLASKHPPSCSTFYLHCLILRAVLTTKVPFSLCGPGQRSPSSQPGHVHSFSRWSNCAVLNFAVLRYSKTSKLLKTTLGIDDDTISSICDKFKQKLLHENFDPAAGRSIDDVRVGHWEESIQETMGSDSPPSLAAECYYLWKNSRLELLSLSPQISDLLKELRSRYKLLVLTNGETQTQREKVEAVGCEEFFDAVVIGGEHEEQKPSLSIFTLCFSMLGVEAQDCIMVGDSLDTDIKGA